MSLKDRLRTLGRSLAVIRGSGLVQLSRPGLVVWSKRAMRWYGPLAGPAMVAIRRAPQSTGLVDDLGPLTFADLDRRSNALVRAWARRGLGTDAVIGLLARDHRYAVDTMIAAGKLGATLVPLNTGIGAGRLAEVVRREGVTHVVHDEEFTEVAEGLGVPRFLAWTDTPSPDSVAVLVDHPDSRPLPRPPLPGRLILLTSGTGGGTPKGAPRGIAKPLAVAQFLDRIPLRAGECTVIAAPLFHGTGLSQFIMSFALGNTVVVSRRFDPEATLLAVQRHRAAALVLVPTMLHRLVGLGESARTIDTSSLRVMLVAGAALTPVLAARAQELFGDVLHNMYGGTEVSVCTVALPEDNRLAPGTVGRPPVGCRVELLDASGYRISEPGVTGRIFAGSDLTFDGYTDGQRREVVDGMVSTGDLGHFDAAGRLFVDGREDDMIISGGENVYPSEVENALVSHPCVADAAVVGVADEEFGQRLKAYVVPSDGAQLDSGDLRAFVRTSLSRYQVPREFVVVGDLPRNSTGKLLRRSLQELG